MLSSPASFAYDAVVKQPAASAARSGRTGRRLLQVILGAVAVALALFHLRLFWQRLSDQSVLEPWVATKWLVSGLLVFGLWRLKAAGFRLFSGKRAGVIWLLALLLHVQLPMAPVSVAPEVSGLEPIGWLLALPASVSLGTALALALGLALAACAASTGLRSFDPRGVCTRKLGAAMAGVPPSHLSRPPPRPF